MHMIDKKKVRDSFTRGASSYDSYALVQKRVVDLFAAGLEGLGDNPERCLDIGTGSGRLLWRLRTLFRDAFCVGLDLSAGMARAACGMAGDHPRTACLAADAEHLPFVDNTFDLVVSTSTFQWLDRLEPAFTEGIRVLRPGGLFRFALFGEKTLVELRDSYRAALAVSASPHDHTHSFHSVSDVLAALQVAGFEEVSVESRLEIEMHRDVEGLFRSLKGTGAGNASSGRRRGLSGRSVMLKMRENYVRKYGGPDGIPATYEVIMGRGRKGWP